MSQPVPFAPRPWSGEHIRLPALRLDGTVSVEEAMARRRSLGRYRAVPLTLAEAAQLLWAAQGITEPVEGRRTAPSAGARYPLELYLVAGWVDGLDQGVCHYLPAEHALTGVKSGDVRQDLTEAALVQESIAGQEIWLQTEAPGPGTVAVGAFDDEPVREIIRMSKEEHPLYITPVGRPWTPAVPEGSSSCLRSQTFQVSA